MVRVLSLASSVVCSLGALTTVDEKVKYGTPPGSSDMVPGVTAYETALADLDIAAVKADMKALLSTSETFWPSDSGSYIGLMVRLTWHCAGSFRDSDQVGGCGGGRIRFDPEASWPDNTNLDKARALLAPIKEKYGNALSWGDLIVLAGTTALRESGMPLTQMCFGRIDEKDGSKSELLGPTQLQFETNPCKDEAGKILDVQNDDGTIKANSDNGKCYPNKANVLGVTTLGLVYVNPEGPMGVPVPKDSALDIKRAFGLMGHSEKNTVALIGAHALGKTHGKCSSGGPGKAPKDAYAANVLPWISECGGAGDMQGKGENTVTSGFEGPWTTQPSKWDNEYFNILKDEEWEKHTGPGGHWQWRIKGKVDDSRMMLTSDLALLEAPFRQYVDEFADDMNAFNAAFEDAWDDLTIIKGSGTWAATPRCDAGTFPEAARGMLGTDSSTSASNSSVNGTDGASSISVSIVGVMLLGSMTLL